MPLDLGPLVPSFRRFQLVFIALRLGLPELLAEGPRPLEELVQFTGVPRDRLVRVMRGLIWAGVVMHDPEGFHLTEAAKSLADGSSCSIADDVLFNGHLFYRAWGHLHDYVATGEEPFIGAHGRPVFELLGESPGLAALFNGPMATRNGEYSSAIAGLSVLADCETIVDVGGGEGQLVIDVLRARPNSKGVVFDIPACREAAKRRIVDQGLASRCQFVCGDMFDSVPTGGDAYLLKWILHDWNDAKAERILRSIRACMSPSSRLLVIERIMPEEIMASVPFAQADLNMLCLNGGKERTERQYRDLLTVAGFVLEDVVPIEEDYGFRAMIAVPAESKTGR
jgi:hypothetical protein